MITLNIYGHKGKFYQISCPEDWNELRPQQLPMLAGALLGISEETRRKLIILQSLTGLTDKQFQQLAPETIWDQVLPFIDWTEEEIQLTEQLLPKIGYGEQTLYGPKSELGNLRLVEWDFAERALFEWFEEEDKEEALSRLCAVLYRPAIEDYDFEKDTAGDCRQPFNDNVLDYYAKYIRQEWPVNVQLAVLLWYRGCRNFITENYRGIFSEKEKGQAPKGEPGYFDLMRAIVKTGIYGDFEKVEQMYVGTALYELKCSAEEAENIKKEMEKARR